MAANPLEGIKVLDVTRILSGPYCTMMLGDLGADVIKIEAPGGSDETRKWGPPYLEGESAYYLSANRNKKGLTLNLKSEEGKSIFLQMVRDADIVVQNFRVGTMEKLGLGYQDLVKENPRIIYCSISGFGQTGRYKSLPGFDHLIQAMSGLMSITGEPDGEPMKLGIPISDLLASLYSVIGILSALQTRNQTGEGQEIDISLLDSQISMLANVASNYLSSGKRPGRYGNQHPNIVPYQVFNASDGKMVVTIGTDQQFKKLCNILDDPALASDPRFINNTQRLANREELIETIDTLFAKKSTYEWFELMQEAGVPCGPINSIDQIFEDPIVLEREMLCEMPHPTIGTFKYVGSPLKFSKTQVEYKQPPPLVGEHTSQILNELGFTEKDIKELIEKKII